MRTNFPKKKQTQEFLKAYLAISFGVFVIFLLGNMIIAFFDLPSIYLGVFKESFNIEWNQQPTFLTKYFFLLEYQVFGVALGLAFGVLFGAATGSEEGLTEKLRLGLPFGVSFGVIFGLVRGLALGLPIGLALGLSIGLAYGLVYAMAQGLNKVEKGLELGLGYGIAVGLAYGLAYGMAVGLAVGLAVTISFYSVFYRLIFYPFYQVSSYNDNLSSNIIMKDGLIWILPLGYKKKIIEQVKATPIKGLNFIQFLLNSRPLQRNLAFELYYVVISTIAYNYPLNANFLSSPFDAEDTLQWIPSQTWSKLFIQLKKELKAAQQESHFRIKLNSFQEFYNTLKKFQDQNRVESPKWNHYYFKALEKWNKEAVERIKVLEEEAKDIVFNPYKVGDPLHPSKNESVFLGRQDLKDELTFAIRSAETMPLFLIQGQRRVGKTSLVNFLQDILGRRFIIVNMDLQSVEDCKDVPGWMNSLRKKFNVALQIEDENKWSATDDWQESWEQISNHMIQHSTSKDYKVIIAMDEYESLQEKGFSKDPEQAKHLLGAIRSFSQHQKQIVFLFIGAALFSELDNPKWSDYFVNVKLLKVDYLSLDNTSQLINQPFPEFPIKYETGNTDIIYEQAKGHPALTQQIGRALVELSNKVNRLDITKSDLEQVIEEKILDESNGTFAVFWGQFCKEECMKDAVRSVILGKEVSDRECLKKLLRHDFIVKSSNGGYKMRAPLFERWVRKFDIDI